MTHHTLAISTLSPLHIGCDEVYEPSNFVIHDGLLYSLDIARLAAELNDTERQKLLRITEEREPIGALQRFFKSQAARFAALSDHPVMVAPGIAREYEEKMGHVVQQSNGGPNTYNLFPIARTAFRPLDDAPYLPGSSLKGSIRTAWLNHLIRKQGNPLTAADQRDKNKARLLQERLLGYRAGKFEEDPFRHVALADTHPEVDTAAPPTRVLYAVSKKKRSSERGTPELKVYLETIPDALPGLFQGELRLGGKIGWNALCDACNAFYRPQLEAELNHDLLGNLIDADWKRLVSRLLGNELAELAHARQGFLLRVGKHSGAESVTLDGARDIKILGKRDGGRQTFDFRPHTTEKRFATLNKTADKGLLPFGWVWVSACDDEHRHLFDRLREQLAERSQTLREAHQERLLAIENERIERRRKTDEAAVQAQADADAEAARQAQLAALTPAQRQIAAFREEFENRHQQLRGGKDKPNTAYHAKASQFAKLALESTDWNAADKAAAADAIEEWLPRVVSVDLKEVRKKLKLADLRAP